MRIRMADLKENDAYEEELLDYEEEDEKAPDAVAAKVNGESVKKSVPIQLLAQFTYITVYAYVGIRVLSVCLWIVLYLSTAR